MRRLLACVLGVVFATGCGGAEIRTAEGRAVFRQLSKDERPMLIAVRTAEERVADVDVGDEALARPGRQAPGAKAQQVETRIEESDLGALLAKLEGWGFFALPGRPVVPDLPAPRSIAIETKERRFYVATTDLRDAAQADVYSKAGNAIIQASLRGGIHISGDKR